LQGPATEGFNDIRLDANFKLLRSEHHTIGSGVNGAAGRGGSLKLSQGGSGMESLKLFT